MPNIAVLVESAVLTLTFTTNRAALPLFRVKHHPINNSNHSRINNIYIPEPVTQQVLMYRSGRDVFSRPRTPFTSSSEMITGPLKFEAIMH